MLTRSPQRHRTVRGTLLTLVGCLTLSATLATAQPYTYTTLDAPSTFGAFVEITAITNLGKLAGTFVTSDIGPQGSWTWINAQEGFRKVSFTDKEIHVMDMNAWKRLVGTWRTRRGVGLPSGPSRPFTINSGRLTTLQLPPLVQVIDCAVNDRHDIVCTGLTADDVIQAVRVKGSTPGILETYPPGVVIFGLTDNVDVVGVQWDSFLEKFRGYFRQQGGQFTSLIDAPCGLDTGIIDVNPSNTMVAVVCGVWDRLGFDETETPVRNYVFDGETWTEIRVPGAVATRIRRINDAGTVVGQYSNTPDAPNDGEATWQGFIATLGEPGDTVAQD